MKRLFVYSAIAVLGLSWVVGCSDESTAKKPEPTKAPVGKTTTTPEKSTNK